MNKDKKQTEYGLSKVDLEKVHRIQKLISKTPQAMQTPPKVHRNPKDKYFQTNKMIFLDTEYSMTKPLNLAYIQVFFPNENLVCIWTFEEDFQGFWEAFLNWLAGDVLLIGFSLTADLFALWSHYQNITPPNPLMLMFKVFDLYLFLKFVHNGFKDRNSLFFI